MGKTGDLICPKCRVPVPPDKVDAPLRCLDKTCGLSPERRVDAARVGGHGANQAASSEKDRYDAAKDVEGSFNDAYAAVRARMKAGGPGWRPK